MKNILVPVELNGPGIVSASPKLYNFYTYISIDMITILLEEWKNRNDFYKKKQWTALAFSNSDWEQYTSGQLSHTCTLASTKGFASLSTTVGNF